jgi:hypothetical protein
MVPVLKWRGWPTRLSFRNLERPGGDGNHLKTSRSSRKTKFRYCPNFKLCKLGCGKGAKFPPCLSKVERRGQRTLGVRSRFLSCEVSLPHLRVPRQTGLRCEARQSLAVVADLQTRVRYNLPVWLILGRGHPKRKSHAAGGDRWQQGCPPLQVQPHRTPPAVRPCGGQCAHPPAASA